MKFHSRIWKIPESNLRNICSGIRCLKHGMAVMDSRIKFVDFIKVIDFIDLIDFIDFFQLFVELVQIFFIRSMSDFHTFVPPFFY